MCRERKSIYLSILLTYITTFSLLYYFRIPRPITRQKHILDSGKLTVYIGRDVDYTIEEIEKRYQKFKLCVINAGFAFKLEPHIVYFVSDTFWWDNVIGVTYPELKVIYIMSFAEWKSFEHELLHALRLWDYRHQLPDMKLAECIMKRIK